MSSVSTFSKTEADQSFLEALTLILTAMRASEGILQEAADEHMTVFRAQMREKVGADGIKIDESFVQGEIAKFRLQFLKTMEKLADRIEENLFSRVKSPTIRWHLEIKAINYAEPLGAQVDSQIDIELTRLKRRFKQSLDGKRQQAFGIHKYLWLSQGDDRVRPDHADNDGEVFSWSNPPSTGHPGEAPNCRCSAEPILDGAGEPRVEIALAPALIATGEALAIIANILDKLNKTKKVVDAARAAGILVNKLPEDESEETERKPEDNTGDSGKRPEKPNLEDPESLKGLDPKDVEKLADKGWKKEPLKKGEGVRYTNGKGGSFEINNGYKGGRDLHKGPYVKTTVGSKKVRVPLEGNPEL